MTLSPLRSLIETNPLTNHLKVKDGDLLTVAQFIELMEQFDDHDPNIKYEPYLILEPYIQIGYKVSKAFLKAEEEKRKLANIDTMYHNDYLLKATLDDFELLNPEREQALLEAKQFVNTFEKGKFQKGLYFFGKYRTGKTYLLSAIANELAQKDIKIIFTYVPDLVRNIKSSFQDASLEIKIKSLKMCDLLILDDLGGESMSSWFRDDVFGPILQYRLTMGLPILVSSNLNYSELLKMFVVTKDDTDNVKAMRIITRIMALTNPIKLSELLYQLD